MIEPDSSYGSDISQHLTKRSSYLYAFDRIPSEPLPKKFSFVFTITEFPFLLLWGYAVYWIQVCIQVGHHAPPQIWQSALVAGLLVGLGLNANAYRALKKPVLRHRQRSTLPFSTPDYTVAIASSQTPVPNALLDTSPNKESTSIQIDRSLPILWTGLEQETVLDIGMIIRFFLIPFAVSSLSGLTSYARDDFILVFPRDRRTLIIYILAPVCLSGCLFAIRISLLRILNAEPTLKLLFFNGKMCL